MGILKGILKGSHKAAQIGGSILLPFAKGADGYNKIVDQFLTNGDKTAKAEPFINSVRNWGKSK